MVANSTACRAWPPGLTFDRSKKSVFVAVTTSSLTTMPRHASTKYTWYSGGQTCISRIHEPRSIGFER